MNLDLSILTAVAVMVHLGASVASLLLKDNTDQQKIANIDGTTNQILGVVSAIAPALPTATPRTTSQIAGDIANLAAALAAATAPVVAAAPSVAASAAVGSTTLMGAPSSAVAAA